MVTIREYIRLIRPLNVLFVVLIQAVICWWMILPTLQVYAIERQTPSWIVWLTILATALIAAGGYVVNDYFDLKIDLINKPDKVIVGRSVSRHNAMRFYQLLTGLGCVSGLVSAFVLHSLTLGLIFIIVPGMLWFYSAAYKRQLIIGNVIVAMSAGLVPLVPLTVVMQALNNTYGEMLYATPLPRTLYGWVCGISLFSFLFTLIREIIKDMQDQQGDREYECHTIPIVWGPVAARVIVLVLIVATNAVLAWLVFTRIPFAGTLSERYYLIGIALPSLVLAVSVFIRGYEAAASSIAKFIMLVGVLYVPVYYLLLSLTYHIPFLGIFSIVG